MHDDSVNEDGDQANTKVVMDNVTSGTRLVDNHSLVTFTVST